MFTQLNPTAIQVYAADTAESVTIFNTDSVNSVTIGRRNNIPVGASDGDMIPPNGSFTYAGDQTLYGAAPANTEPTLILSDVTATSLPPSTVSVLESFQSQMVVPPGPVVNLGPFPVAIYSSIFVAVANIPAGQRGRVSVIYTADAAGTQAIRSKSWLVNNASGLLLLAPVLGPFVKITLTPSGPGLTADVFVGGLSNVVEQYGYPNQVSEQIFTAQAIAAATATVFQFSGIQRGQTNVSIVPADNTGSLLYEMVEVDSTGTVVLAVIDTLGSPTTPLRTTTIRTDGGNAGNLYAMRVTNSDAVNPHTFSGTFITLPG